MLGLPPGTRVAPSGSGPGGGSLPALPARRVRWNCNDKDEAEGGDEEEDGAGDHGLNYASPVLVAPWPSGTGPNKRAQLPRSRPHHRPGPPPAR